MKDFRIRCVFFVLIMAFPIGYTFIASLNDFKEKYELLSNQGEEEEDSETKELERSSFIVDFLIYHTSDFNLNSKSKALNELEFVYISNIALEVVTPPPRHVIKLRDWA